MSSKDHDPTITASLMAGDHVSIRITGHGHQQSAFKSNLRSGQIDIRDGTSSDGSTSTPEQAVLSDEEESYEALTKDPNTAMKGSSGIGFQAMDGFIRNSSPEHDHSTPRKLSTRRSSTSNSKLSQKDAPLLSRSPSLQIFLERTDKTGRYILTADDPEIRELLRESIEREAEDVDNQRKSRTRFQDMVFTRRFTTFDRQNPASSESPFHGFFTLFWIAMGLLLVKVAASNWRIYGSPLGEAELLHLMFERDILVLGLTDGVMVGITIFGLGLQKLILKGWMSWERTGWIVQNLWQTAFLFSVLGWTYVRDWPWTHSIFMCLHALVFVMKQHSYAAYNGYLSQVYRRRRILQQKLDQLDHMEPSMGPTLSSALSRAITSSSMTRGWNQSPQEGRPNTLLKHRRNSANNKSSTDLTKEKSQISAIAAAIDSEHALNGEQMHAFSKVMRREIKKLDEELNGKSMSGSNAYPKNLTVANWADWTCLPTLVYELEYPRQDKINWWYVAEKTAATFGVIWCMMVISQAFIYPSVLKTVAMKSANMPISQRWIEFPWIVSDMLFPLLLEQLLTWYVIWECCLNVLAEVTRFADRGFYGDWWNSVSWDQYARDWNRPVHAFLLRHVYHSSISTLKLSKKKATLFTFFLSALVHELIMFVLFKKVRGYLFAMQLSQVPLAALSRTKILRDRHTLGNVMFWFGLFVGPAVITSLYLIV